jgi:hypothetical protein
VVAILLAVPIGKTAIGIRLSIRLLAILPTVHRLPPPRSYRKVSSALFSIFCLSTKNIWPCVGLADHPKDFIGGRLFVITSLGIVYQDFFHRSLRAGASGLIDGNPLVADARARPARSRRNSPENGARTGPDSLS